MEGNIDRRSFYGMGYGMYVVASYRNGKLNGQIANTVFQVSSEPPQIATAISKNNLTHDFIAESGCFAVTILSENTPFKDIGWFGFRSGRDIDKFENIPHKKGASGCPFVLENGLAGIEVKVVQKIDVGSHTLFIGEVTSAEVFSDGTPLTYAYYREHIKGKTPSGSPTYTPPRE